MQLLLFYLFVGVLVVEVGIKEDEDYSDYVRSSMRVYTKEVLLWMPDMIIYLINGNDEEGNY